MANECASQYVFDRETRTLTCVFCYISKLEMVIQTLVSVQHANNIVQPPGLQEWHSEQQKPRSRPPTMEEEFESLQEGVAMTVDEDDIADEMGMLTVKCDE